MYKNFRDLCYLQQYERASVIGIVRSVSKFLVKKYYIHNKYILIVIYTFIYLNCSLTEMTPCVHPD